MNLDDSKTRDLLCDWNVDSYFLCDGLDQILQYGGERNDSLPSPLTLDSCKSLTDEEMQALYFQYGVVYYPDVPRDVRAWFLWQATQLYRFWGTPRALEVLSQYIMGSTPIHLIVHDNLAWNERGELVHEDLLHTYDVEIEAEEASLNDYTLSRILANLHMVSRNQEWCSGFTFTFPEEFNLPVRYVHAPEAAAITEIVNDDIAVSPAIPFKAFTRSSAYQHLNKSIAAHTSNFLYDEGMDTSTDVIQGASYTLTGAFTAAGTSVDITGCSLYTGSVDGKLRLVWGDTASAVCYIEYAVII